MYDDNDTQQAVFDFDGLAEQLVEQGQETSPSEIHGCLCGLLCAGAQEQLEFGLDALSQSLGLVLHGELAGEVMRLYGVTAVALEDEEFDFHPLLPGDDHSIEERTIALAGWCRGFLAGFAHETTRSERGNVALPGDSGEILKDFAAMSQAAADDSEDEDDAENSYMELFEYLRFATLNLYMENRVAAGGQDVNPGQVPPLH